MLSDRQNEIITTSIGLIDEKGIQGFTIKNLAKEIGISEPAIYRHFDSKMAIMSTILDSFKSKMNIYHQQKDYNSDVSGTDQLKEFFGMIFRVFTENPSLVSVIFAEEIFQNEPLLTSKILEIQTTNEVVIKEMLSKLKLDSKLANVEPEVVSIILFGSVRLLVRKWKMGNYQFNLKEKGAKLIETILIALQ